MPHVLPVVELPGGRYFYRKATAWVVSPRVRAVARAHFGCPTLRGMALEDYPLEGGYGHHWEARLTGPEVLPPPPSSHVLSSPPHPSRVLLPVYLHLASSVRITVCPLGLG
jgi:hypothetical protein